MRENDTVPTIPPERRAPDSIVEAVASYPGLFFSLHYDFGMALEKAMRQGAVSMQQASALWIIRSEAGDDGWARRRKVELALQTWFECSNSKVSRLLNELSSPPFQFIRQASHPDSNREKVVSLTQDGIVFFNSMLEKGKIFLADFFSHVDREDMLWGLGFMAKAFERHVADVVEPRNIAPDRKKVNFDVFS
ncbi:hypothetical protein EHM94_18000 [Marinobacter sp. NP-6]|uniref:hypothetical protein n=1 Tax=Marinobacter sp. NP-6 TaxID=2488666 RepID=UPI000FCAABF4|nr:hypothetical protein [Marinobacter sp. NP-6]RUT76924.1 hypothetical protein EHM94_18000 [Marinobacter sp. NP-6]